MRRSTVDRRPCGEQGFNHYCCCWGDGVWVNRALAVLVRLLKLRRKYCYVTHWYRYWVLVSAVANIILFIGYWILGCFLGIVLTLGQMGWGRSREEGEGTRGVSGWTAGMHAATISGKQNSSLCNPRRPSSSHLFPSPPFPAAATGRGEGRGAPSTVKCRVNMNQWDRAVGRRRYVWAQCRRSWSRKLHDVKKNVGKLVIGNWKSKPVISNFTGNRLTDNRFTTLLRSVDTRNYATENCVW